MYCHNCGREIPDGSSFCRYCGAKQKLQGSLEKNEETTKQSGRNYLPVILAILCIVFIGTTLLIIRLRRSDNPPAGEVTETEAEQTAYMDIPADAIVNDGHSYYLFDVGCRNWDEVLEYCYSRGGYPAVIENSDENDLLVAYMRSLGYECTFIGYTDRETEGEWKWVDGRTSSFTDWGMNREGEREPNADTPEEDYAQIDESMVKGQGHWNDCAFGWDTNTFICEWDGVRK